MWRETFDSEQQALDQKALHVDFVMEMKMDEVGGEWSAEQLMEAHRAGKQQEAFPSSADDHDHFQEHFFPKSLLFRRGCPGDTGST